MRDEHHRFKEIGATIVVVTRHDNDKMKTYWKKEKLPFRGIADPDGKITARYGQTWRLLSLGRMPAQVLVNCHNNIVVSHYGDNMADILPNDTVLASLEKIRTSSGCPDQLTSK